jgi:hypothetical protein
MGISRRGHIFEDISPDLVRLPGCLRADGKALLHAFLLFELVSLSRDFALIAT